MRSLPYLTAARIYALLRARVIFILLAIRSGGKGSQRVWRVVGRVSSNLVFWPRNIPLSRAVPTTGNSPHFTRRSLAETVVVVHLSAGAVF